MVYIAADGSIQNGPRPWDIKRVKDTFWSFLDAVGLFVQTLLPFPVAIPRAIESRSSRSQSSGNRSNNFQPARRSGGPSNRPTGGFRTMSDIRAPPPPTSCCSGGGCGM